MNILLLGANGQVGWELRRSLAPLGRVTACDRTTGDLGVPAQLRALVEQVRPDVIVNAAAYTAVDRAETDVEEARRVNFGAVAELAQLARAADAWLVHYSTDYVFDGKKTEPYSEEDAVNPLNVYGQTKLEGERAIVAAGCRHLIFRTSWVYAARGGNFARTMLRLAGEREQLTIVADQVGAPTSAELIADVTALALLRIAGDDELARRAAGIYHLVAGGETSWHGYARHVIGEGQKLGLALKASPANVLPISSGEYPVPARRPLNSRLATDKLRQTFGLHLPRWEYHVERLLKEITAVS